MPKRLTPKQHALIKAKISNPDATSVELASQVGYGSSSTVRRALASPNVKARVAEMMERRPLLKREARLDKLEQGLEAWKRDPAGPENIPDFSTRHKYLETAFKLAGDLSQEPAPAPQAQILILNAIEESRKLGISE